MIASQKTRRNVRLAPILRRAKNACSGWQSGWPTIEGGKDWTGRARVL